MQLVLAMALAVGVAAAVPGALAWAPVSGELASFSMAVTSGGSCGVEGANARGASADGGGKADADGLSLALALVPMGRADAHAAGGDAGER